MGYALVTEGYMDLVALAQLGFANAVATLGTACTPDHIHKLFRFTDRKSTRLNSSHLVISYAVFCLKKKKEQHKYNRLNWAVSAAASHRTNGVTDHPLASR